MYSFIFTIHHECSYVDGMCVINAHDFGQAETIFRRLTWGDILKPGMGKDWAEDQKKELIIENDGTEETDVILAEYPEKLPKEHKGFYNVWCLLRQETLSGEYDESGFVAFSYHDG